MIDLFSTNFERPEEDEFVLALLERFDGRITAIGPILQNPLEATWIEVVRAQAVRPRRAAQTHTGQPVPEQLDETIKLGAFSAYEKAKPRGSVRPWRLVWSGDREPLLVGLFDSEDSATNYRRR